MPDPDPAPGPAPEPGDAFWDEFETHEMIMEATVWVLAEEGYGGLTLRKIAERAGKNRGLVHYYFESKDDLLLSLLDHILEGMGRLVDVDETDEPLEQLRTAMSFFAYGPGGLDESGRHYYAAIFQLQALAPHDDEIRRRLTRNYRYTVDLVRGIIEDGIERGQFRRVDPEATAISIIAAIDGARIADLTLDVETARKTTVELTEQVVSETLVA